MALNTRSTARRGQRERGETEGQDHTEGAAASRPEKSALPQASTPRPLEAELGDGEEEFSDADYSAEEDELAHYAELAQEELEERIQRAKSHVMRKRKERELVQLRKELRGEPTASLRDADETTALLKRASKRARLSENDSTQRTKGHVRPAEPVYYCGKNVKELEEFLIFWVIHWEAEPGESQATRVRTAARYLRDTPMKLWGQRIQSDASPIETWDEFKQWLRDSLKAPNQRVLESTLAIKEMRQRESQTCKDVYIYMCELENNIPTMTVEQQRAWTLINALRPELRSRIVRDLPAIDSVDAVIACAGRNESTLLERTSARSARASTANESESRRSSFLPTRKRFDRDSRGSFRGRGRDAGGSGTQATRERGAAANPRSTTACWNCGKEDHRSADCPDRKEAKNG